MKSEKITIKESDWESSKYRTKEWEQTVEIVKWEHHYPHCDCDNGKCEGGKYVIDYKEKKK